MRKAKAWFALVLACALSARPGGQEDPFLAELRKDMGNEETAAALQRLNDRLERELAEAEKQKIVPLSGGRRDSGRDGA